MANELWNFHRLNFHQFFYSKKNKINFIKKNKKIILFTFFFLCDKDGACDFTVRLNNSETRKCVRDDRIDLEFVGDKFKSVILLFKFCSSVKNLLLFEPFELGDSAHVESGSFLVKFFFFSSN